MTWQCKKDKNAKGWWLCRGCLTKKRLNKEGVSSNGILTQNFLNYFNLNVSDLELVEWVKE